MVQERRERGRFRVFKAAKLVFGRASVIDCTVRDLNAAGVGVSAPTTIGLPQKVEVTFDGRTFRAGRIAWRLWNRAGIQFDR